MIVDNMLIDSNSPITHILSKFESPTDILIVTANSLQMSVILENTVDQDNQNTAVVATIHHKIDFN